jgi:hypothetical protein
MNLVLPFLVYITAYERIDVTSLTYYHIIDEVFNILILNTLFDAEDYNTGVYSCQESCEVQLYECIS